MQNKVKYEVFRQLVMQIILSVSGDGNLAPFQLRQRETKLKR